MDVGQVANLLWHLGDLVVGGVDFGAGETLPPVLIIKVNLVDMEQLSWDLLDILPNVVERTRL